MPALVLFRGYSYRPDGHRRPSATDYRKCVDTHHKYLITPLKERYGACDVILTTYDIPQLQVKERERHHTDILRDYNPDIVRWLPEGGSQRDTTLSALEVAIRAHAVRNYDLVVMSRFDLKYKMSPWEFGQFAPDKLNFLWREWKVESWLDHHRVPDCIHTLPGSLLHPFREGIRTSDGDGRCLHTIWNKVCNFTSADNLHIQHCEGFTDSNTDMMENPVYHIVRK